MRFKLKPFLFDKDPSEGKGWVSAAAKETAPTVVDLGKSPPFGSAPPSDSILEQRKKSARTVELLGLLRAREEEQKRISEGLDASGVRLHSAQSYTLPEIALYDPALQSPLQKVDDDKSPPFGAGPLPQEVLSQREDMKRAAKKLTRKRVYGKERRKIYKAPEPKEVMPETKDEAKDGVQKSRTKRFLRWVKQKVWPDHPVYPELTDATPEERTVAFFARDKEKRIAEEMEEAEKAGVRKWLSPEYQQRVSHMMGEIIILRTGPLYVRLMGFFGKKVVAAIAPGPAPKSPPLGGRPPWGVIDDEGPAFQYGVRKHFVKPYILNIPHSESLVELLGRQQPSKDFVDDNLPDSFVKKIKTSLKDVVALYALPPDKRIDRVTAAKLFVNYTLGMMHFMSLNNDELMVLLKNKSVQDGYRETLETHGLVPRPGIPSLSVIFGIHAQFGTQFREQHKLIMDAWAICQKASRTDLTRFFENRPAEIAQSVGLNTDRGWWKSYEDFLQRPSVGSEVESRVMKRDPKKGIARLNPEGGVTWRAVPERTTSYARFGDILFMMDMLFLDKYKTPFVQFGHGHHMEQIIAKNANWRPMTKLPVENFGPPLSRLVSQDSGRQIILSTSETIFRRSRRRHHQAAKDKVARLKHIGVIVAPYGLAKRALTKAERLQRIKVLEDMGVLIDEDLREHRAYCADVTRKTNFKSRECLYTFTLLKPLEPGNPKPFHLAGYIMDIMHAHGVPQDSYSISFEDSKPVRVWTTRDSMADHALDGMLTNPADIRESEVMKFGWKSGLSSENVKISMAEPDVTWDAAIEAEACAARMLLQTKEAATPAPDLQATQLLPPTGEVKIQDSESIQTPPSNVVSMEKRPVRHMLHVVATRSRQVVTRSRRMVASL